MPSLTGDVFCPTKKKRKCRQNNQATVVSDIVFFYGTEKMVTSALPFPLWFESSHCWKVVS